MIRNTANGRRYLAWVPLGVMGLLILTKPAAAQKAQKTLPPLSDFSIIEDKNLFHPDRIPQVPLLSPKEKGSLPPEDESKNFVLHGVILMRKGKAIALLQEPILTEKKVRSFTQGEKIGPYVLKAVKKDRVVLAEGDREFEVILHKKRTPAPPKPPGVRKPRPQRTRPRPRPRP
jgi:type II secretory pathway component PulC